MKFKTEFIKSRLFRGILCIPFLFLTFCQDAENEIIYSSEVILTKDSKIVPLLLKAVGATDTNKVGAKSFNEESQCTEFVYPMTFYAYSSDAEEPAPVIINSNEELVNFLTSLTSGQEFFIVYPVTLVDVDGVETVINDYPDLEGVLTMAVDACQGNDDSDDDSDGDDGDDDSGDDDSDDIEYEYCGNNNKKVVICHNGQTICISINAIWGHMQHHEDDYFGTCNN